MGLVAMPFIPEPSPEEDLAMGKRYFANQCETLTLHRKINRRFDRGHKYCECVAENLDMVDQTGDEYGAPKCCARPPARSARSLRKPASNAPPKSAREKSTPMIGQDRLYAVNQYSCKTNVGRAR